MAQPSEPSASGGGAGDQGTPSSAAAPPGVAAAGDRAPADRAADLAWQRVAAPQRAADAARPGAAAVAGDRGGGVAPRGLLTGAACAAVVSGAFLTPDRPGLGWLLTALVLAGTAIAAGLRPGTGAGPEPYPWAGRRRWRLAASVVAVLLVADGLLRAAGWLFALCVLTAIVLAGYTALSRSRGAPATTVQAPGGTWAPARDWPPGPGSALRWCWAAVRQPGLRSTATVLRSLLGLGLGLGLVLVFGALFTSADPVFADAVRRAASGLALSRLLSGILVGGLVGTATVYAGYLVHTRPGRDDRPRFAAEHGDPGQPDGPDPVATRGRSGPVAAAVWAPPLLLLDALFGWFIGVQVESLYGGNRYVLGPGGPDYAVYARGGFDQLVAVALLTAVVIFAVARWGRYASRAQRATLRVLAGALCLLALAVVASAVSRMVLYAGAYGFTRPRLLALVVVLWLGGLFVLILLAGVRLTAAWLPRVAAAVAVVMLLGLVALNPDRYIAHTVIARYEKDGHLDADYLASLSDDAAPEIATLPASLRDPVLWRLYGCRPHRTDPWYAVNLGRALAPRVAVGPGDRCAPGGWTPGG